MRVLHIRCKHEAIQKILLIGFIFSFVYPITNDFDFTQYYRSNLGCIIITLIKINLNHLELNIL